MKLIDADLLHIVISKMKEKYMPKLKNKEMQEYALMEFQIWDEVLDAMRACTCPTYTVMEAKSNGWIPCSEKRPDAGVNVILRFRDTFHTDSSWPKIQVMPAWICNVSEDMPDGEWAIEGRLGNYTVDIQDGIEWQPLPV